MQTLLLFCLLDWIGSYFGYTLWICCILTRMLKLFVIIERKKKPLNDFLTLFLLSIPSLILTIIAHGFTADKACIWVIGDNMATSYYDCNNSTYFDYALLAIWAGYLITGVVSSSPLPLNHNPSG